MIKSRPEDFVVEENAALPLRRKGEYRLYRLRKSHWNTVDLISHLSRRTGLPREKFCYGGKKDKHGLTYQFITVRDERDYSQEGKDYSLELRGFMDRPMGPDLIQGNSFAITLRNMTSLDTVEKAIGEVGKSGFPNFFDDQRFRSYDPVRGFFAEKILRRHWNGALQVYLTGTGPDESKRERERKEALFSNWKDWPDCLKLARKPVESRIFEHLSKHPRDFAAALHEIPREEVSMLYSAYQAHLWNEVLRRLLRLKLRELAEIRGAEGGYLFWRDMEAEARAYFGGLEIPTAAAKMDFPDGLTRSLHLEILRERSIPPGWFRTKALRRAYFRSFKRRVMIIPEGLRASGREKDELHRDRMKMTLAFFLPRGAYGTMLVKRITLKPRQWETPLTGVSH
jgi:tRNA pseudouridine13 synthase